MGASMGMLFVWDTELDTAPSATTAIEVVAGVIRPGEAGLPYVSKADAAGRWVVDAGSSVLDATMSGFESPMGFAVLSLCWSSNALCQSNQLTGQRMDLIEAVATVVVDQLRPRFGYLTHYSDGLEEDWLESLVFVPLLAENWHHLASPSYHLVAYAPTVSLPRPANSTVLHASDAGTILRLREHRSPFGELPTEGSLQEE
jgi:hypothetical protein